MDISRALKLEVGQLVNYPADRGSKSGKNRISFIGSKTINKNHKGVKFIWVNLSGGGVWPSNRLTRGVIL